jgi:hypothetical protein
LWRRQHDWSANSIFCNVSDGIESSQEELMKTRTKIWLGIGTVVVAGTSAANAGPAIEAGSRVILQSLVHDATATAVGRVRASGLMLAQHRAGGEAGEAGGEMGAKPSLPPDLDFALKIEQIRGHLLVGDQLVKLGQWNAAYPHFGHPTEELYGGIRARLKEYKVPPFEAALKVLANVVKSRKGGDDYAKALAAVNQALAAADAGLKEKQTEWASFTVEAAVELVKSATGEYEEAIVNGRIAKPVEYQDARGFIWQAEKMIESVAPALEKKDAEAFDKVRTGFAELKKGWPSPMPPKAPVKDLGAVLSDVARIELSAGKLM